MFTMLRIWVHTRPYSPNGDFEQAGKDLDVRRGSNITHQRKHQDVRVGLGIAGLEIVVSVPGRCR